MSKYIAIIISLLASALIGVVISLFEISLYYHGAKFTLSAVGIGAGVGIVIGGSCMSTFIFVHQYLKKNAILGYSLVVLLNAVLTALAFYPLPLKHKISAVLITGVLGLMVTYFNEQYIHKLNKKLNEKKEEILKTQM